MGKIDIDYQILHDAFFKHQKKPRLTVHGDLYYEGKEYEIRMRGYKPGRLSPELRAALGIPENSPPPWLINMQSMHLVLRLSLMVLEDYSQMRRDLLFMLTVMVSTRLSIRGDKTENHTGVK
jgi:hypothetical protein